MLHFISKSNIIVTIKLRFVKLKRTYNTKSRRIIVDFFKNHPNDVYTSGQIISHFTGEVSAPTVYRLLKTLNDEGQLRSFCQNEKDGNLYQYCSNVCGHHLHMTCLKCGEVYHMDCGFMNEISSHIKNEHSFELDNSKSVLFGICKKCGGGNKNA